MEEPALIALKSVFKIYQTQLKGMYALKDIDISIFKGDIFGIIGMSGAGKSTLIRCLTGLEQPTEGEIWLQEDEISSLPPKDLRKARQKIGMIFQHFHLFSSRSAIENVCFPLEISHSSSKDKAKELLALVGLKGKEHLYPSQMSGGEKQRVAIARALANDPAVLLCDEATSALDPKTTDSILELLSSLNKKLNLTIILITHEMDVVKKICNKVAVLEYGEIVEKGEVVDLFASPKHPTTERFLRHISHELPLSVLQSKEDCELLRLSFRGDAAQRPIISQLIKNHEVEVNILLGSIDALKTETIGSLIVELKGTLDQRESARVFLKEQGVKCHELE